MTEGACPSCGAPVQFSAGSAQVVVCGHCQTVVARRGAAFEARGKVAALVDTDSPFQLGVEGRYKRVPFRIVGHLQKDHGAGPWDEWYLEFDDDRAAWLSEAEGELHLLFASGVEKGLRLDSFPAGQRFPLRGERYVVEERGRGRTVSAAGQLPRDVSREGEGHYVDATAPQGRFVTLDFGAGEEDPEVFLGERVELEALGISPNALRPRVRKVSLQQARCTECNGPLELRAPDRTKRVGCPYCGALLDASQGKLAFLQLLEKPERPPLIPLGARGTLKSAEWLCIGFLERHCRVEGVRYPWTEYLLFHPVRGFTWLMHSNGHWVFLRPVPAGEVAVAQEVSAHYEGRHYRCFQSVTAVTDAVQGELYWEVAAGERTRATEYVAPPHSINVDATLDEVSFTHGEYLVPEVVRQAFGLKGPLPAPEGVAPSQPNPEQAKGREVLRWTFVWLLLLAGVAGASQVFAAKARVVDASVQVPPGTVSGSAGAVHFEGPFEVPRPGNVKLELTSPLRRGWLGVQGELVREGTSEVHGFYLEVTDEVRSVTDYLSRIPAGRYTLKSTAVFPASGSPVSAPGPAYRLALTSGSPRGAWFWLAAVLLFVPGVLSFLQSSRFEAARWAESNMTTWSSSDE